MMRNTQWPTATTSLIPAIDGIRPDAVAVPASAAELADLLADAAERGLAVAPVGGGTALALGNPPERVDLAVATERLSGVLAYEPADLTVSVGAGMRFGELRAVLAEHGQGVPLDVPEPQTATIGGIIATGLAGPRRLGSGTLRDLLIGISAAHPSGTVTKAGGMVVKNVTGFDLPRLYHGSLGTLGIIVSANLKVLPLLRAETTVLARFAQVDAALAAAGRVRAGRLQPLALEVTREDHAWLVAVRQGGRERTIDTLTTEAIELLRADTETVADADSAAWWQGYVDEQVIRGADGRVLVRCATRPGGVADLTQSVLAVADEERMTVERCWISVGLGTLTARLTFGAGGSTARLRSLQERLLAVADTVTILAAPPAWKRGLDVWGHPPAGVEVMRNLKEQFDPSRVLNPGRFAGYL